MIRLLREIEIPRADIRQILSCVAKGEAVKLVQARESDFESRACRVADLLKKSSLAVTAWAQPSPRCAFRSIQADPVGEVQRGLERAFTTSYQKKMGPVWPQLLPHFPEFHFSLCL